MRKSNLQYPPPPPFLQSLEDTHLCPCHLFSRQKLLPDVIIYLYYLIGKMLPLNKTLCGRGVQSWVWGAGGGEVEAGDS